VLIAVRIVLSVAWIRFGTGGTWRVDAR